MILLELNYPCYNKSLSVYAHSSVIQRARLVANEFFYYTLLRILLHLFIFERKYYDVIDLNYFSDYRGH